MLCRMLTIGELVALDVGNRLSVVSELAEHWGWTQLQQFRSSDNHVLRCSGPGGAAFLRFAPAWHRTVAENRRIAVTATALVRARPTWVAPWSPMTSPHRGLRTGEELSVGSTLHIPQLENDEHCAPPLLRDLRAASQNGLVPASIRGHALRPAHAVLTVVSVSEASGEADPSWPDWAAGLRRRFDEIIEQTESRFSGTTVGRFV